MKKKSRKTISYADAPDIREKIIDIILVLGFTHIRTESLSCIRSHGSGSRRIIARCHALPKIMQKALNTGAHYIIEVISERFDSQTEEEKMKTLIHELMHVPRSFGGGFVHHNMVNRSEVEKAWKKFTDRKKQGQNLTF